MFQALFMSFRTGNKPRFRAGPRGAVVQINPRKVNDSDGQPIKIVEGGQPVKELFA